MILNIQSIKDVGTYEKERIIMSVQHDGDVGGCLIALSQKRSENSISAHLDHVYWIPNQEVKENDLIVIYSKKGQRNSLNNDDGSTTYFFYWGLEKSFSEADKALVLFDAKWTYKLIEEDKEQETE